ncbi:MAG: hypothetical protein H0W70_15015 [Actinobacteria bacterium]|nr:hypothetical protein [Actinomycetota bacterium]
MARIVVGAILCLIGLVWFFQGVGAIGGSFMSGEAIWAVIGAVAFAFGASLLIGARRSRA